MQQRSTGPRPSEPRSSALQQTCQPPADQPDMRHTFPCKYELCARENDRPVTKPVVPNVVTEVPSTHRGARSIVSDPLSAPLAPYRRTNTLRPLSDPSLRLPDSQSLPSESVATPPSCARIVLSLPHVRCHTGAAFVVSLPAQTPPARMSAPTSSRELPSAIDTCPSYGIATPGRRDHAALPPCPNRSMVSAPGTSVSPLERLVADHPAA